MSNTTERQRSFHSSSSALCAITWLRLSGSRHQYQECPATQLCQGRQQRGGGSEPFYHCRPAEVFGGTQGLRSPGRRSESVASPNLRNMATIGGDLRDVRCWYSLSPTIGPSVCLRKRGGLQRAAWRQSISLHFRRGGSQRARCAGHCPAQHQYPRIPEARSEREPERS